MNDLLKTEAGDILRASPDMTLIELTFVDGTVIGFTRDQWQIVASFVHYFRDLAEKARESS